MKQFIFVIIVILVSFNASAVENSNTQQIESLLDDERMARVESLIKEQKAEIEVISKMLAENQSIMVKLELQSKFETILDKSIVIERLSQNSIQAERELSIKLDLLTKKLIDSQKKIEKQSSSIEGIQKVINESSFYYDYINPVVLSIIAAIIFWLFFSYLPEENRTRLLRKKIDLNFLQIYNEIFFVVDMTMRPNSYSPSFSQQKITAGSLKERDVFLGLQNKCLNETCFYDPLIEKPLHPIGKELYKRYATIDKKIESIFHFSSCLSSGEILLLEELRTNINTYGLADHEEEAGSKLGDKIYYPDNPSLSYMSKNIFDIYKQSQELLTIVADSSLNSRDILIKSVMFCFYNKQFSACKKLIEKNVDKFKSDTAFLNQFIFICELELGNIKVCREIFSDLMKNKPDLVSNRNILGGYINNKHVSDLFNDFYSEAEVNKMRSALIRDANAEDNFINDAEQLENYYTAKSANQASA